MPDLTIKLEFLKILTLHNIYFSYINTFTYNFLNNVTLQTIESSAREFLGNHKSSTLAASVV